MKQTGRVHQEALVKKSESEFMNSVKKQPRRNPSINKLRLNPTTMTPMSQTIIHDQKSNSTVEIQFLDSTEVYIHPESTNEGASVPTPSRLHLQPPPIEDQSIQGQEIEIKISR